MSGGDPLSRWIYDVYYNFHYGGTFSFSLWNRRSTIGRRVEIWRWPVPLAVGRSVTRPVQPIGSNDFHRDQQRIRQCKPFSRPWLRRIRKLALPFCKTCPQRKNQQQFYWPIFSCWAASDPLMAAEQAAELSARPSREIALQAIGLSWAKQDPDAALAWANSFTSALNDLSIARSLLPASGNSQAL